MNHERAMLLTSLLIAMAAGCGDSSVSPPEESISITRTRGPVEVTLTADRAELEVGQDLMVTVKAVAEDGVDIIMPMLRPNANGTIGSFVPSRDEVRPDVPVAADDPRRLWQQTLVLDTFAAGPREIPATRIAFVDRRRDPAVEGAVELDALPITVTSLLDDEGVLRSIRGPVTLVTPWPWWAWAGLVIGGLGLVGLLLTCLRGRGLEQPPPLSPADQARRDLASLEASDLLARGDLHPFYVRLTDILRHYLEGRFGLRAPQTTTPEFLREAGRHQRLTADQRQALDAFLRTADMVKFARHQPTAETGRSALASARDFVEETAEPESTDGTGRAAA